MRFVTGLLAIFYSAGLLAASVQSDFTFENDGDLTNSPFGTVTINDNTADRLGFDISVDTSKLGAGADIEQFGFMLDFGGAITLISGTNSATMTEDDKVKGRNSDFDYVVDFGSGNPFFDMVSFVIEGTGLDLNAILTAGISSQNNKPDAQFQAHVQSTSTTAGSESIGGDYNTAVVPVPAAAWLFPSGLVGGLAWIRRRRG